MSGDLPSTPFADAWIQVDRTEDPTYFVELLDATRAELKERAERSPVDFFAPLKLEPGHRVLDAGCGTGDFIRLLAPLVAPGSSVGVDLSETMIAEARRRSNTLSPNLSFRTADVQDLPFEDSSFDRIMSTQVLLHVPAPARALAEMGRVLSRKGTILLAEYDWGTLALECTDREFGRRFARLACDGLRNGLIVRELPWRLRELGFDDVQVIPEVRISHSLEAFHRWFVVPAMSHFARIGGFTPSEVDAFLGDLNERAQRGRYFCSRTYYSILASRSE